MRARSNLTSLSLIAFSASLFAGSASAKQATGSSAFIRRELITQAQQASIAGNHQQAYDLAMRAAQLDMSPSLRLFLAQEQGSLHRVAQALGNAEQCIREVERDPRLPDRNFLLSSCRTLRESLRTQVGRVTVTVPTALPPGLRVMVDGEELNSALYGLPVPVSPGAVIVDATATGVQPFHREIQIAQGGTDTVALWDGGTPPPVTTTTTTTNTTNTTNTTTTNTTNTTVAPLVITPPPPPAGPGAAPWIVVGVGAASFIAFIPLAIVRQGAIDTLEAQCGGADHTQCSPAQMDTFNTALGMNIGTNVTLVLGSALVVAGVTWFAVGTATAKRPPPPAVTVSPTAGGAILRVGGSF